VLCNFNLEERWLLTCIYYYSVLQCVAVCCTVRCSVLQCVAVCCSVLQCVAVCCSVLRWLLTCIYYYSHIHTDYSRVCMHTCIYIYMQCVYIHTYIYLYACVSRPPATMQRADLSSTLIGRVKKSETRKKTSIYHDNADFFQEFPQSSNSCTASDTPSIRVTNCIHVCESQTEYTYTWTIQSRTVYTYTWITQLWSAHT